MNLWFSSDECSKQENSLYSNLEKPGLKVFRWMRNHALFFISGEYKAITESSFYLISKADFELIYEFYLKKEMWEIWQKNRFQASGSS